MDNIGKLISKSYEIGYEDAIDKCCEFLSTHKNYLKVAHGQFASFDMTECICDLKRNLKYDR